jgi:hypothetical protein
VFDDAALLDDEDTVGQAHGTETVADEDDGALGCQVAEALENVIFSLCIQSAGGFVKDENGASRMQASARAIFCHSPPLKSTPFSNQRPSMAS